MVGLPTLESRELILRSLLSKEKAEEGIDYKELATITEGYSGSDLKVCLFLYGILEPMLWPSVNLSYISNDRICVQRQRIVLFGS